MQLMHWLTQSLHNMEHCQWSLQAQTPTPPSFGTLPPYGPVMHPIGCPGCEKETPVCKTTWGGKLG